MAIREINLIPPETLDQQHQIRHIYFWTGCLIISLTLIFGVYLFQMKAILDKKEDLEKLKETHQRLATKIEEIKKIQIELNGLIQQHAVVNKIGRNQPYSQVLLSLADTINEHTWLTLLVIDSGKDSEDGPSLQISGFARSNEDLGGFLSQLSDEPKFKAVVLKYAREAQAPASSATAGAASNLIQFEIECNVQKL